MRLKVVSLNIWQGGQLFDQAFDFLHAQTADIYTLQEAYDGHGDIDKRFRTVEILEQDFPDYELFFSADYLDTREKEGEVENGQLVLSRFPLLHKEKVFTDVPFGARDHDNTTDFSNFPSGYQLLDVKLPEKQLRLLNVHGPVDMDGHRPSKRRQSLIKKMLSNVEHPCIACGDFNMDPNNPALAGMSDELKSVFDYDGIQTTFNLKRKNLEKFPGYAQAMVDMFFVSPEIKVLSKNMPQLDVSDHLPMVVELEV